MIKKQSVIHLNAPIAKMRKAEPIGKIQKKKQYELLFRFSPMCDCKDSIKFIKNDKDAHKKLLNACLQLTKFHIGLDQAHKTLDIKGKTSPSEYKKLSGEGIEGYQHKFKLDGAKSMLVREETNEDDGKLYIYLAKIGNYH